MLKPHLLHCFRAKLALHRLLTGWIPDTCHDPWRKISAEGDPLSQICSCMRGSAAGKPGQDHFESSARHLEKLFYNGLNP